MPRKPSAAIPRSETTAELIARISAERDAPPAPDRRTTGRSRAGVLDAPAAAPARRQATRVAGLPRQRTAGDGDERRPRADVRTRRSEPTALPRQRRDDHRAAPRGRVAMRGGATSDVQDLGPEPDDTPTVVIGYLEPIAPRRRGLGRRLVPLAVAAAALVGIGVAAVLGYTFPGFGDPGAVTPAVLVDATVPEPAPTGPTVPAPVNGAPQEAAPAADPQSDVTVTDAAVPESAYTY